MSPGHVPCVGQEICKKSAERLLHVAGPHKPAHGADKINADPPFELMVDGPAHFHDVIPLVPPYRPESRPLNFCKFELSVWADVYVRLPPRTRMQAGSHSQVHALLLGSRSPPKQHGRNDFWRAARSGAKGFW